MTEPDPQPEVSVVVFTYNHGLYLREALDSILRQKVSFPIEIVIGEDCSTDNTRDICREYEQRFPSVVRLITSDANVGASRNVVRTLYAARGKFIACLEGDDYFSDENKLQKQRDVLVANAGIVCCYHWQRITNKNESGIFTEQDAPKEGQGYYPAQLTTVRDVFANRVRLKTRTLMFRNVFRDGHLLPDWYLQVRFGDVPLVMFLGQFGGYYFIDEPMAVYRYTGTGVSTAGNKNPLFTFEHYRIWVKIWELAHLEFKGKYREEALTTISYFYRLVLERYDYSIGMLFRILRSRKESVLDVAEKKMIRKGIWKDFFRGRFNSKGKK